jgi:hypothetical protein
MQLQPSPGRTSFISGLRGSWSVFAIADDGTFENVSTMHAQLMRAARDGLEEEQRAAAASVQQLPFSHSTFRADCWPVIVVVVVFAAAATGRARDHSLAAVASHAAARGNTFVHFADNDSVSVCWGGGNNRKVHLFDQAASKRLRPFTGRFSAHLCDTTRKSTNVIQQVRRAKKKMREFTNLPLAITRTPLVSARHSESDDIEIKSKQVCQTSKVCWQVLVEGGWWGGLATFVKAMHQAGRKGHGPRGSGRVRSHSPGINVCMRGSATLRPWRRCEPSRKGADVEPHLHADAAGFVEDTQSVCRQQQHGFKSWYCSRIARLKAHISTSL